jgi:hypothetical protein
MRSRTLFAWMLVAILITAGVFFTYHIAVATQDPPKHNGFQEVNPVLPKNAVYSNTVTQPEPVMHAEPLDLPPEPPKPMPVVVGQTETDLRATRQVSETPPSIKYPEPEAKDPMEDVVNSESEFGDNLRHPEQTIEILPPMGSLRTMSADAEDMPSMGGHESVQYGAEMAHNGGEFMSGIFAFDGTDMGGVGYSMI